jgi:glycosyltransferase involved in cell wall biosynthesis
MTVSVALASFDGSRFIREQLESIAAQTLAPFELVVCDDGSTDDTCAVVEAFARDVPFPVQLHRNSERLGVASNFMRAASLCSGDLVAFADQDDVWLPGKLERCAVALETHDARLVVHACEVVDESLQPLGRAVPDIPRERVAEALSTPRWAEAPGMAMVFDGELLAILPWESRPPAHHRHGRLLHDEWVLALARLAGRTAFLPDRLVLYRQHPVNVEGAPTRGLRQTGAEALTGGADYYERRREQAAGWAELLRGGPFAAEGRAWAALATSLALRAQVHDRSLGRIERAARLANAARAGAYRPRCRDGFGFRGLLRDAALVAGGR